MNEVKRPRKPLLFYYCLVLILLLLFNWFILPQASQSQIKDTDYGTFMTMTEKGQVDSVEIQQHQILFKEKGDDQTIYRTGIVDDPQLVSRLHENGVEFTSEIVQEASPFMTLLLSWVLPLVVFIGLGSSDSDPYADKVLCSELGYHALHAVVCARASGLAYPYGADRKIDIVVNDYYILGRNIVPHRCLSGSDAASVHICLGLYKHGFFAGYLALTDERVEFLASYLDARIIRKHIYGPIAHIVPCVFIILTGIAKSYDHIGIHGRSRLTFLSSEKSHQPPRLN